MSASSETAEALRKVTPPPAICLPRGIAHLRSDGPASVFKRVTHRLSSPAKVGRAEAITPVVRSGVSCSKAQRQEEVATPHAVAAQVLEISPSRRAVASKNDLRSARGRVATLFSLGQKHCRSALAAAKMVAALSAVPRRTPGHAHNVMRDGTPIQAEDTPASPALVSIGRVP